MRNLTSRFQILYDTPGAPGAGGGGSAVATPPPAAGTPPSSGAGAPPAPPAAPAGTPGAGTPPAPAAGAPPSGTPPASAFSYPEDRSAWLSPEQVREQQQQAIRETQARAERFRAMAEAAAGIKFPSQAEPLDPRVAEARQTLEKILPGITEFHSVLPVVLKMAQAIQRGNVDPESFGSYNDIQHTTRAQWRQHGANALRPIHTALAQDLGVESLTPRQRDAVTRDFISWLEEDRTGQRADRYTNADPTLGNEYLEDYRGAFIHPLQRRAPAAGGPPAAAGLPPAPRAGAGAPPAAAAATAPTTLDQAADAAYRGFVAAQGAR